VLHDVLTVFSNRFSELQQIKTEGAVAMSILDTPFQVVEQEIWAWINDFVTKPNAFYNFKFAPCPYAKQAVLAGKVDVQVWPGGDVRQFIRDAAISMRQSPLLTTRVMAFPPKVRFQWGMNDYVEELNSELVPSNVFLNTGVARGTISRYPGSPSSDPYFIVIANSLAAVLSGAESLAKSNYYQDWPAAHYAHVVERRARMAQQYGIKPQA
jgi:hypothetical protein